ncbi:MAG TPA: c-type cytochrome domain-containing protein, partial [Roseimicrobium sp.]|nr:c-type cytochrome domain-containing protein [Roseimicrobium sp.]
MRYLLATAGCLLWNSATAADAPVSFKSQIAPILSDKCLTCHSAEKAKGKYRLHTFDALLKTGSSGDPAVTPGKPDASELYRLLLEKDPENRMPQNADPLTKGEIQLIERWIKQGARFDGDDKAMPLASLIPRSALPSAPKVYPFAVPVSGLAFVKGGTELAASGYHEITLWSSTNGALVRRIGGLEQQVR